MAYDRKAVNKKYYEKSKEKTTTLILKINKDIGEKFKEKLKKENITYKEFTLKNIEKFLNK